MINYIILTKTTNEFIYLMTNNLLQSLKETIYPAQNGFENYRIIIVESQKECQYTYDSTKTINFDFTKYNKFNYNYALNQGLQYCLKTFNNNDWFVFMNNDIVCDKNWICAINDTYNNDKRILSFSPFIKNTKYIDNTSIGYILGKNFVGWCFMYKYDVYKIIGEFDEKFDFYFQDDDYIEQLKIYKLLNASIKNCIVQHIGQQTTGKEDIKKLLEDRDKFIVKYSVDTYIRNEREKRIITI